MHLYGGYGDADISSDLFIETARGRLDHDLPLARAKSIETLFERMKRLITLPTSPIPTKAVLDSIEQLLVSERLGEELYCTALHRLYGHGNIAVRRDEYDWDLPVGRSQFALELKTTGPRHSNIEHEAARALRGLGLEKIGNG